jgi:uracil-DNA glycosylase
MNWAQEFASVIACNRCTEQNDPNLARDANENVPQPGYIGPDYPKTGVLLVGQNPGWPQGNQMREADQHYTRALRELRENPTEARLAEVQSILGRYIRTWQIYDEYFPLTAWGWDLEEIAYCNMVRCRTHNNKRPRDGKGLRSALPGPGHNCKLWLNRWMVGLRPSGVVFLGKYAADNGSGICKDLKICYRTIDRNNIAARVDLKNTAAGIRCWAERIRAAHTSGGSPDKIGYQE